MDRIQARVDGGAHPVVSGRPTGTTGMVPGALSTARTEGVAESGDGVVTPGVPCGAPGTTNLLRVAAVKSGPRSLEAVQSSPQIPRQSPAKTAATDFMYVRIRY